MRNVEGLELSVAVSELEKRGIRAQTLEVSSRKGVDGNERRVVRAIQTGDSTAVLTWAWFKTAVDVPKEQN